jgi:hypothetical protein
MTGMSTIQSQVWCGGGGRGVGEGTYTKICSVVDRTCASVLMVLFLKYLYLDWKGRVEA